MKKIILLSLVALVASFNSLCYGQTVFTGFDSLSSGMTSPRAYVLALAMKDSAAASSLYAGGYFTIAGRTSARNVAEWVDSLIGNPNKGIWKPLGSGVDSDVCALSMYNNYLYAGGKFDSAGGIAASHIARWDTASLKWDSLAGKLNGNVYALCVYNNYLYVGGDFTLADGDTVNRIAVWKDSLWAPVGKGFDTGAVYALTVSNDTLYAGGSFLKSNGTVVNHIAKLSGNNWDSVGSGTNNTVYALADDGRELYVGGAFTLAGNISAKYIASYDDYYFHIWSSFNPGVNDTVRALNEGVGLEALLNKKGAGQGLGGGNLLLIGGNFDSAGGYSSHYLAVLWDGLNPIEKLDGPVYALATAMGASEANFIGGRFQGANADTLNNVATIFLSSGGGVQNLIDKSNIAVYPNPGNGVFTFQVKSEALRGNDLVEIYNILGEKVYSAFLYQTYGDATNTIDISNQQNGMYMYRVIAEDAGLVGEGKLIIQK